MNRDRYDAEQLRQQRVITWLILTIGIAVLVFIIGMVVLIWSVIL